MFAKILTFLTFEQLNGIDDLSLNDYNEDDNVPKSVKEYLDKVIHRADGLQRDLDECEHLLSQTAHGMYISYINFVVVCLLR